MPESKQPLLEEKKPSPPLSTGKMIGLCLCTLGIFAGAGAIGYLTWSPSSSDSNPSDGNTAGPGCCVP